MIGEFPILDNHKHNYYNSFTCGTYTYDISFDITDNDDIFIKCKNIIFTDISTKITNNPTKYYINFIDILHCYSLIKNNISELDTKNNIIKSFFFNNLTFNIQTNIVYDKLLFLDIFSFFREIDIFKIDYDNKDILIDVYSSILTYFNNMFNNNDVSSQYKNIKLKSSSLNTDIITRILMCIYYKQIKLTEYKLDTIKQLLTDTTKTINEFVTLLTS